MNNLFFIEKKIESELSQSELLFLSNLSRDQGFSENIDLILAVIWSQVKKGNYQSHAIDEEYYQDYHFVEENIFLQLLGSNLELICFAYSSEAGHLVVNLKDFEVFCIYSDEVPNLTIPLNSMNLDTTPRKTLYLNKFEFLKDTLENKIKWREYCWKNAKTFKFKNFKFCHLKVFETDYYGVYDEYLQDLQSNRFLLNAEYGIIKNLHLCQDVLWGGKLQLYSEYEIFNDRVFNFTLTPIAVNLQDANYYFLSKGQVVRGHKFSDNYESLNLSLKDFLEKNIFTLTPEIQRTLFI